MVRPELVAGVCTIIESQRKCEGRTWERESTFIGGFGKASGRSSNSNWAGCRTQPCGDEW